MHGDVVCLGSRGQWRRFGSGPVRSTLETDIVGAGCHVSKVPILLQKSAVTDDAAGAFHLGRRGLVPDPGALYATLTLRNAQSLSGWRPSDKGREPPQVLSNGGQNKLVLSASWTTQSQPAELQGTLQMREPHLDLLALTA